LPEVKLSLVSERNVEIIVAQGPILEADTHVLRAGIQKFLKSGKNRIILELPASDNLPSEVLRELARFDIVARELAGRIVLADVSATLKTKIAVFAKPPVILCFETRAQAVEFLTAPPKPEFPSAPAAQETPPAAGPDPHEQEFSSLKEKTLLLEQQNKSLEEQLIQTTIKRRVPADEAAYLQKIKALESKIEALLLASAPPPAAPGAPAAPGTPAKT
jgi:hypothetical protein